VGHREDLLVGARECLYDQGWGATSARDIVAASKTNLASIGYHFGSKDALLTAALVSLTTDWAQALDGALTEAPDEGAGPGADTPMDRFERTWSRVIALVSGEDRLVTATVEALAQVRRVPEVRAALTAAQDRTREDLALMFHATGDDDERARVLGGFYQALLIGVMVQWVVEPSTAPSGSDLAAALRAIVADGELRDEPRAARPDPTA
jgi:AcrR family transcriptional regulator